MSHNLSAYINHESNSETVRYRICQFIYKLLSNLPEEADLDEDICENICEVMMERLQDKAATVRAEAVKALLRLQDPLNPDCPVIKAYIFHLSRDPSQDVRLAIINAISRSNTTLPFIVERTRDVKPAVRIEAYKVLGKLNIKAFSIEQREQLLFDGLQDRDEKVKNAAVDLLLKPWFHNLNRNFIDLLHLLDVECSKDTHALVLQTLFKMEQLGELLAKLPINNKTKLIPLENLTPQSAVLWQSLGNYLNNLNDSALESVVPELTHFCNYINSYLIYMKEAQTADKWTQIQHNFILKQLLLLAKEFDLSDELGRSNLKELLINALLSQCVKVNQVAVIVDLLVQVIPDTNTRLHTLAEVVSEMHEPMFEVPIEISPEEMHTIEMEKAAIRLKLMEAKEQLEIAIEQREFSKAGDLNSNIGELENKLAAFDISATPQTQEVRKVCNDSFTLCKCLTIIYEMMQSESVTKLTPHLRSLLDNFVNCVEVVDSNVLNATLKTVAVYGLLDEDLAQKYFLTFCLHLAEGSSQDVSITSAKAIFDLLLKYGLSAFQITSEIGAHSTTKKLTSKKAETESNESGQNIDSNAQKSSLIPALLGILDSTDTVMRQVAAEGLSKLLLSGRIFSAHVLTRLIVLWFNPITSDDPLLRQMLECFFNEFARFASGSQELMEQSFLQTLSILLKAPPPSPLANVDVDRVADFMIKLTRPGLNRKEHLNVHNLVVRIFNEVQRLPQNAYNTTYLKAILKVVESVEDENVKGNLLNAANKVVTLKEMTQHEDSTDDTDNDHQTSGIPGFVVPDTPSDSSSDSSSDISPDSDDDFVA